MRLAIDIGGTFTDLVLEKNKILYTKKVLTSVEKPEIAVIEGVLEQEAKFLNRAFIHRVCTGRPWGALKWAMSLDGRTALSSGASNWITGKEARSSVHALRSKCDAVIIGGNTLRKDN